MKEPGATWLSGWTFVGKRRDESLRRWERVAFLVATCRSEI